jgi:hypothetical protein
MARSHLKRWFRAAARFMAMAALGLGLSACSESATGPQIDRQVDQQPEVMLLRATTAADLSIGASDVLQRLLPAISDSTAITALRNSVISLDGALTSRSLKELTLSTDRLKTAFDHYTNINEGIMNDPDLGAVRVLLDQLLYVTANPPVDTLQTK